MGGTSFGARPLSMGLEGANPQRTRRYALVSFVPRVDVSNSWGVNVKNNVLYYY